MMLALGRPPHGTSGGGFIAWTLPLLWLPLLLDPVSAARWTVTSYYALSVTTLTYSDYYRSSSTVYEYTRTRFQTVKPDATITAAALSTSTSTYSYDDLEVVKVWLPPSAVGADDIQSTPTYPSYDPNTSTRYTYYVQPVAYTAPQSCPTPFTVTTSAYVDVPSAVASQLTATATSTSVYTDSYGDAYTRVTAYLDKTYWPSASELSDAYLYSMYVANCENPWATTTSTSRGTGSGRNGGSGSGSGSGNGNGGNGGNGGNVDGGSGGDGGCEPGDECGHIQTWAIVLAAVLPAVFLLGFVESFVWFSRLMTGKATMRFGTLCWLLLCCPIIFLTRHVPSRSTEDRERLREQWKHTGMGKKLSLWVKLGLRHRYPVELLGDHPDYKPDGWAGDQQMRSNAGNALFVQQQPSQGRPQPQPQPQPTDLRATAQQQTQRRSSQRMPTIREQPSVPPQARLSGQTSPSIVVSSVSDDPASDMPSLPQRTTNVRDGTQA